MKRQSDEGVPLTCLICQEEVVLNHEGVDGLNTAVYVQTMQDIYNSKKDIKCSKCNGRHCSLCVHVSCNKCNKYISTVYCKICRMSYCLRCTNVHSQYGHSVIDMEVFHQLINSSYTDDKQGEWDDDSSVSSSGERQFIV